MRSTAAIAARTSSSSASASILRATPRRCARPRRRSPIPIAWINDAGVNGFGAPDGVPITYVIDAEGIIRDKFIAVPPKLLNDVVVPMLKR